MKINMLPLKFLKYTSLKQITFWDFSSLSNKESIFSNYPIIKLGEVINQRKEIIIINDDELYKRCRVQIQAKGVVLRDEVFGKEIKTKKQQLCKTNDFLVAEIDAKVGGYGIVPSYLENAIVSSHYFLFEIDKTKLTPEFLGLVVKQFNFSKQIKSTGSTNYAAIRPYHVLEYEIPLPTLHEQNQIVAAYNKKVLLAKKQDDQAKELEKEIEKHLLNELEIKIDEIDSEKKQGIQLVQYKNIERWAVDHLSKFSKISFIFNSKYPIVKLKQIILNYQYGLSEKAEKENIGIPMLRMNNILNSELNLENLKYIKRDDSLNKFILNKGDLLFNRTNSKELVGKTAIFDSDQEFTFASYLIRVVLNPNIANNYFINFLFNSKILQIQKDMVSRQITGQANINAQEMQEFLFPLPSLEKQKEISDHLILIKLKIKELKTLSHNNEEGAMKQFENKVFK